ncbi:MAG: 50S ribosomal protein L15 [Armatimonadota bacterium]|nr:50S ribosomal protein L15 [Armatimonadota bacterium]
MSDRLARLRPAEGAVHPRKRVGRGIGSGSGKTAGRGTKGQNARGSVRPGFEGGQTPLARRVPRLRGFKPPHRKEFAIVNLAQLKVFEENAHVTPEVLIERGIIRDVKDGLKVLGNGELPHALTVSAHKFSAAAQEKIQAAGGTAEVIPVQRGRGQPEADAEEGR